MKNQMLLLQKVLLADASRLGGACTHLDYDYIEARVNTEGISFLTITLPEYAKDLQKALSMEQVDSSMFTGFGRRGQLPTLLGGLLSLVFDSGSGRLLDNPSIPAIQAIRQVTMAFGKVELECSNERIQTAISGYIECEREIRASDSARSVVDYNDYGRVASLLWSSLNSSLDRRIYDGELTPAHGPGSVADRLKGNAKWTLMEWTNRLEAELPFLEYARAHRSAYLEIDRVDYREPGQERPVKVITVPKTLKTPRVIAVEPTCMMFVQQGVMALMKEDFRAEPNAKAFICFDSQEPNRALAQEASRDGRFATLDLKEASDRVSNQLVIKMFERFPHLSGVIQASRSRSALVNGKVIRLAKFASMGSALTFPIEAMVFCTLVFLGIERALNRQLTRADIKALRGQVRVYGDDIIVPVAYAQSVIDTLEAFGARVNRSKSFWTGLFRESCGGDFYAGFPVGVARVRRVLPESRKNVEELVSAVSLRNQLSQLGYFETVEWLDRLIGRLLPYYPRVTEDSPILGRVDHGQPYEVDLMDSDTQSPLTRGYVVEDEIPQSSIDGYDALLKVLCRTGEIPFEDPEHLTRSGRALVVRLTLRMASPV
jgi:hypothetical protein